ncbi:hypothetical protein ACGF0D_39980 [Kitasatospora sp. NPDC048298]|uniref:hypothetical protein n=1 Tax=Kitasatospora sp. NPDC048298 TaxID=3364049 RepID=UPI00371C0C7E
MPPLAHGALVHNVPASPDEPIKVFWAPHPAPPLPLGRIRLRWEPATGSGWDVTAHLGLATTEVHLATWLAAADDWPRLVRPTLREVTELCSALAVATAALRVAVSQLPTTDNLPCSKAAEAGSPEVGTPRSFPLPTDEDGATDNQEFWGYREMAAYLGINLHAVHARGSRGSLPAPDDTSVPDRPRWKPSTVRAWKPLGQGYRRDLHGNPPDDNTTG